MTSERNRQYRLIDADSHVTEPPDLWLARTPSRLRDRVPHIERFDEGDAWVLDGVDDPINFGMNNCAGLPPEEHHAWVKFDDLRRGGFDPAVRLRDMDRDGVDGALLYPTPRLSQAIVANRDVELHLACVRAYNDWLSEFVAHAPERLGGLVLLPNCGAETAIEELERVLGRAGMRGVLIGCYPNGSLTPTTEDDKVWARVVEAGVPVCIHVSLGRAMPKAHKVKLPGWGRFHDAPTRMLDLVFGGVFDRFPELQFFFAEVDCGWVPYVKEQIDNNYGRLNPVSDFSLRERPGAYIEQHFQFGYMTDTFGIRNRHDIGVDRILWSSDYPHISADWPHSWKTIQASFSGVPVAERDLILGGNAAKLFHFD
jgi:predicted TIM-barrel fold metal-dependent hydrolase